MFNRQKRQNLIDLGVGTPKTVGNYLIALEEKGFFKIGAGGKGKTVPRPKFSGYFRKLKRVWATSVKL